MKKNIQYKSSELLRKEKKLALLLILPTICLVLSIVLIPLIANFWISFKPISLGDLRPPTLIIKENIRGKLSKSGEIAQIHYRYRNSSTKYDLNEVIFTDFIRSWGHQHLSLGPTVACWQHACTIAPPICLGHRVCQL